MKKAFSIAVVLLALHAGRAEAQEAEIIDFTYAGEGCPAGSVGWVFNPAANLLTVNYDSFYAWLLRNPADSNPSSACTLSFVVDVPDGFQLSLNKAQFLGFVDTEPGVRAQIRTRYQYHTNTPLLRVRTFGSGASGDFRVEDRFTGWSNCEDTVTVNANTRIRLTGTASYGGYNEIVVDAGHFETKVIFAFNLLPCP